MDRVKCHGLIGSSVYGPFNRSLYASVHYRCQRFDSLFSDVIDCDLIEQNKHLKYMNLVANAVILHRRRAREPLVVVLNRAEFNGYCPALCTLSHRRPYARRGKFP